jgi:methionyl-tRNA formyltransferase
MQKNEQIDLKVIFLGRKPVASECLRYLSEKRVNVLAVVAPKPETKTWYRTKLCHTAQELDLPVVEEEKIYQTLRGEIKDIWNLSNCDLVISLLHGNKIIPPLLEVPKIAALNWHPAPLPEFRGYRAYNLAILENSLEYGVTVHEMEMKFDAGNIVWEKRFAIVPSLETAFSLEKKTMIALYDSFVEVIDHLLSGEELPRRACEPGPFLNRKEMESLKEILPTDTTEIIDKKIRAFWFPPYDGAWIEIDKKRYTLVEKTILSELGKRVHEV